MSYKFEIPERFDLVSIKYKCGSKGFAFAPTLKVKVGDHVITDYNDGIVQNLVSWCTPEDDYYKAIAGVMTVDRITHKIVEVNE
jgi:hypothetical protein